MTIMLAISTSNLCAYRVEDNTQLLEEVLLNIQVQVQTGGTTAPQFLVLPLMPASVTSFRVLACYAYNNWGIHEVLSEYEDFRSQKRRDHIYRICKASPRYVFSYEFWACLTSWIYRCKYHRDKVFHQNVFVYDQSDALRWWSSCHSQRSHT